MKCQEQKWDQLFKSIGNIFITSARYLQGDNLWQFGESALIRKFPLILMTEKM